MKKAAFFIVFTLCILAEDIIAQKDTTIKQEISSWTINNFFEHSDAPIDTTWFTLHEFDPAFGNIYLSSFGSPIQHNLYTERHDSPFIFKNNFLDYFYTKGNTRFYRTTTPFTYINYNSGGGSDKISEIEAFHTQNVNEYLNFRFKAKIITSSRFYEENNEKTIRSNFISLSGSYERQLYETYFSANTNSVDATEIGGIQDRDEFEQGIQGIFGENLTNAQSVIRSRNIHLSQKLNLSEGLKNLFLHEETEDTIDAKESNIDSLRNPEDSLLTSNVDTTVTHEVDSLEKKFYLIHNLDFNSEFYRYSDNDTSDFYSRYPYFIDTSRTRDKTRYSDLSNNLGLSYISPEFRMNAGINHQWVKFSKLKKTRLQDTLTPNTELEDKYFHNTHLYTHFKKYFFQHSYFEGEAGYYFTGFKQGDYFGEFNITGTIDSNKFSVNSRFEVKEPHYYYQHYNSNYFQCNNSFSKITQFRTNFKYRNLKNKINIDINSRFITNHVYLDSLATPRQFEDEIILATLSFNKTLNIWKFYLDNNIHFQYTNNDTIINIPKWYIKESLSLRHTFHFDLTGGRLHSQIGIRMYYYPEYYADAYMPATSLFYNQRDQKIGGKFIFNVFANFKVKRTSVFIKGYHINSPIQERNYYSAPGYPMSPLMLKFGIIWSFYD